MKSISVMTLSAALALSAQFLSAQAAQADTWFKAESAHFNVYSNVDARSTEAYVRNLERYRYVIGAMYRKAGEDEPPMPKLNLYFVGQKSLFKQVWPKVDEDVAGFVRICRAGTAAYSFYDNDALQDKRRVQSQTANDSQTVLFHEYAHHFMFEHSQRTFPRWFVEGFAEFYGTTRINDNQALIGMAWGARVQRLNGGGLIDWQALLKETIPPDMQQEFYAQSWLLTHWIMSDPARARAFSTFLKARNDRVEGVKAFEDAFGVPVKTLDRTLQDYLNNLRATVYTIKDMPDPEISVTALPKSADKLLLWDSAATSCVSSDYEPVLLERIRTESAKYPGDAYAQGVLARAEIELGAEDKAVDYYTARVRDYPTEAEGYFRLGQAWYLMTQNDKLLPGETRDTQVKKARAMLNKAYQLDPLNALNLYYFSRTGASGPDYPDDSTLNAAYEAHLLAPAVKDYAINAAVMLLIKGRRDEAKQVLSPIANNPHGGTQAERIRKVIEAIDEGKPAKEVLTQLKSRS
ncbi:MAG: hypothetical protein QM667_10760 [Asticcacaulis sp.]